MSPRSPSRRRAITTLAGLAAGNAFAQLPGSGGTSSIAVPFSAGTISDIAARKFASFLASATGGPCVVENLPGASGVIAAKQVLRRPADGRAMLWAHSGLLCALPLLASPPLDFDPLSDFIPVCTIVNTPLALVVGRDLPAANLAELRKVGLAQSGPITYAANEFGSASQVGIEVLLQRMGLRGMQVPYKNAQQAWLDVAEGRVQLGAFGYPTVAGMVRAGALKAVAVLGDKPLPRAPELLPVPAQGLGAFDAVGWFALLVARGTPRAAIDALERQMRSALSDPDYLATLADTGQEPAFRGPRETRDFIASQVERYRTVLRELKLI